MGGVIWFSSKPGAPLDKDARTFCVDCDGKLHQKLAADGGMTVIADPNAKAVVPVFTAVSDADIAVPTADKPAEPPKPAKPKTKKPKGKKKK